MVAGLVRLQSGGLLSPTVTPFDWMIMAVNLTKPVKAVEPFAYLHTRQWASTVDCAVSVGEWIYEGLCDNDLQVLADAFNVKINGSRVRRDIEHRLSLGESERGWESLHHWH